MSKNNFISASIITIHCLIGCIIGEFIGLVIGVTIGLSPMSTMILATILAFITGMLLAILSVVRNHKVTYILAAKTVWLGEIISISVMELAMNGTDYWIGGVSATSIFEPIFWIGFILAIPAGYIAALPVNYFLLKRNLKKCH